MADRWAEFRFLQYDPAPTWEVVEWNLWWVLDVKEAVPHPGDLAKRVRITVMPVRHDENLAVDASLEFLDRLRERRVPKFVDSPDDLMSLCVKAAIRQE